MSTETIHPRAEAYLARLERAAAHLPADRRRELVADIHAHLTEALGPDPSDAEVLTVLDRLGEPEEIVASELPAAAPPEPRGTREWAAIILLALGGFVAFVGWIAGLILLWSSRAWTTRDKLIGTLLWPGGLATGLGAGFVFGARPGSCAITVGSDGTTVESCSGGIPAAVAIAGALVAVLVPVATAVYLARRARRSA